MLTETFRTFVFTFVLQEIAVKEDEDDISEKGSDSEEEETNRDSQSEKDDGSDRDSDREQDEKQNKDDEAVRPDGFPSPAPVVLEQSPVCTPHSRLDSVNHHWSWLFIPLLIYLP